MTKIKLYYPKWMETLFLLINTPEAKRYCEKIYKGFAPKAYFCRIVKCLSKNDLLEFKRKGTINFICFTAKGKYFTFLTLLGKRVLYNQIKSKEIKHAILKLIEENEIF